MIFKTFLNLIKANLGMVDLINFYFADSVISLFINVPISKNSSKTFQKGLHTHDDFWKVNDLPIKKEKLTFLYLRSF
jgi:hypothetical protein